MKPFGRESSAHKLLKQQTISDLRKQGYEVYTEYRLHIIEKLWIVDVVGFRANESIAVECGHTPYDKIEALKSVFTKVVRHSYSTSIYPRKELKQATYFATISEIPNNFSVTSKIFGKGRVQLPAEVRRTLNVKDGDKIVWIVQDGKWVVEKA